MMTSTLPKDTSETDALVAEFLAKGGKIQMCPEMTKSGFARLAANKADKNGFGTPFSK